MATTTHAGSPIVTLFHDDAELFLYRDNFPNGLLFKTRDYCRLYRMQDEPAWRFGRSPPYTERERREGYKRNVFTGGGAAIYAVQTEEMASRTALLERALAEISPTKKWWGNPPNIDPETKQALSYLGVTVRPDGTIVRGGPRVPQPPPPLKEAEDSFLDRAGHILRMVPQIILQGLPGTGKTYTAKRLAAHLLGVDPASVSEEESKTTGQFHAARFPGASNTGCWALVQFHPAYAYDDFVRGIQADTTGGSIAYKVVRRVLDQLVEHHRGNTTTVLIIDEINRANLAQVLGELIYALEYRGSPVQTPYQIDGIGAALAIPRENFFIIGTMNTADRSIGRFDYAVRRRFAFLQLDPDGDVILRQNIGSREKAWAEALFDSVGALFNTGVTPGQRYLAQEFHPDDVQPGHTYFLGRHATVRSKFAYQVYPLLREYFKDGVLLSQNGKVELALPGGVSIDLAQSIGSEDLLSELDRSWSSEGR